MVICKLFGHHEKITFYDFERGIYLWSCLRRDCSYRKWQITKLKENGESYSTFCDHIFLNENGEVNERD